MRRRGRELSQSLGFWFRQKYNLPPLDDRYLSMTEEAIQVEYWAHHYASHPNEVEVVDEEFDLAAELADADAQADDLPDDFVDT